MGSPLVKVSFHLRFMTSLSYAALENFHTPFKVVFSLLHHFKQITIKSTNIMSKEYEGQDPLEIAKKAETDLNSQWAKEGHRVDDTSRGAHGASDSTKV